MTKRVLVAGAGVAGSSLAYWLARYGYAVTVIERASGPPPCSDQAASDVLAHLGLPSPDGDIAVALYERNRDSVRYVFGDSIASLTDAGDAVVVTFEHGPPAVFDLVVGADGPHSVVRRLAFPPRCEWGSGLALYLRGRAICGQGFDRLVHAASLGHAAAERTA
ncbi:FAD-dependent oxidoreductase [Actinomadura atramentaria]|uniref:FAD-dependent oxidoreductase n=1 Tax=Actinomadura atramentaria TaxID=1990 RepID=UPI00036F0425|nr:FAD-dependent oxidoreductase [Actinomadura atramentaria]